MNVPEPEYWFRTVREEPVSAEEVAELRKRLSQLEKEMDEREARRKERRQSEGREAGGGSSSSESTAS